VVALIRKTPESRHYSTPQLSLPVRLRPIELERGPAAIRLPASAAHLQHIRSRIVTDRIEIELRAHDIVPVEIGDQYLFAFEEGPREELAHRAHGATATPDTTFDAGTLRNAG
jgi:hypothetical protein